MTLDSLLIELRKHFPGENIMFSPVVIMDFDGAAYRYIVINGKRSRIRFKNDILEIQVHMINLFAEVVMLFAQEITVYLEKYPELRMHNKDSLDNVVNQIKKEIYGNGK